MNMQLATNDQSRRQPFDAPRNRQDLEVLPLLRSMKRDGVLVAVRYGAEQLKVSMATITDIDGSTGRLRLRFKGDRHQAEAAISDDAFTIHARRKTTAVQFPVNIVRVVDFEPEVEVEVELGEHLLSYDRRRYYRLCVPVVDHVRCMLSFHHEGQNVHLQVAVADISEGGVAILSTPGLLDLTPGTRYVECRIELPGTDSFVAQLEVRNAMEHQDGGNHWVRIGCAFVGMSGVERMLIRHYIDRLEYQWREWLPSLDFSQRLAA